MVKTVVIVSLLPFLSDPLQNELAIYIYLHDKEREKDLSASIVKAFDSQVRIEKNRANLARCTHAYSEDDEILFIEGTEKIKMMCPSVPEPIDRAVSTVIYQLKLALR